MYLLKNSSIRYPLRAACWSVGRIHNSVGSCNAGQAPAGINFIFQIFVHIQQNSSRVCVHASAFTHVTSVTCNTIRILHWHFSRLWWSRIQSHLQILWFLRCFKCRSCTFFILFYTSVEDNEQKLCRKSIFMLVLCCLFHQSCLFVACWAHHLLLCQPPSMSLKSHCCILNCLCLITPLFREMRGYEKIKVLLQPSFPIQTTFFCSKWLYLMSYIL